MGIAMFNTGSPMSKFDELSNLVVLIHIDIIGVTEIWLHDELKDHEGHLPGYVLFRQGELGVALNVKSKL